METTKANFSRVAGVIIMICAMGMTALNIFLNKNMDSYIMPFILLMLGIMFISRKQKVFAKSPSTGFPIIRRFMPWQYTKARDPNLRMSTWFCRKRMCRCWRGSLFTQLLPGPNDPWPYGERRRYCRPRSIVRSNAVPACGMRCGAGCAKIKV